MDPSLCLADAMDGGIEYGFLAVWVLVNAIGIIGGLLNLIALRYRAAMVFGVVPFSCGMLLLAMLAKLTPVVWDVWLVLLPVVPLVIGVCVIWMAIHGLRKSRELAERDD
jgi:hypothetical protein